MEYIATVFTGLISLALLILFFWLLFRIKGLLEQLVEQGKVKATDEPKEAEPAPLASSPPDSPPPLTDAIVATDPDLGPLTEREAFLLKMYGSGAVKRERTAKERFPGGN